MKRFLKIAVWAVGGLTAVAMAAAAGLVAWALWAPVPPVSPETYPWPTGASDAEMEAAARELLAEMSLEEKIAQMGGDGMGRALVSALVRGHFSVVYSGYNRRLNVPPIAFSDGPRGIVVARATAFPVAMARAATWDVELERRVGEVFGREARAAGANYFGGVCINLLRHPSWGRAQETYGEDPWLVGAMGVAVVEGVQRHNVMACAKHFALNSIENSRFQVDVRLDERTLREVYLPHFERVTKAGVASIMSAYNRVRGDYCGHNRYLLTEILRDDWGFQGFVTSDWFWGLRDPVQGVAAGMDVEMPTPSYYSQLPALVREGTVREEDIDLSVLRILRTKLRFLTRPDPMSYPPTLIAAPEHTKLAREVSEQGMVLLRNRGELLPLNVAEISQLGLVGRLLEDENSGDHGSSNVYPPYRVTPAQGLRKYLEGKAEVLSADGSDLTEADRIARQSDVVIAVVGFNCSDEGEYVQLDGGMPRNESEKQAPFGIRGGDRYPLGLKVQDIELIRTLAAANPRTVVVLIGGSAITMEDWEERVPAILMAWYFGMEGGRALPRVLFGDVNPSGKLPVTIPRNESQLPPFDPYSPTVEYGYYHGYTLLDKLGLEPAFPFGFGLSFTRFEYSDLEVATPEVTPSEELLVRVRLTNTGSREGAEVVQLYVGFADSRVDRPVKLLRGFRKLTLAPGSSQLVNFAVPVRDLAWYNPEAGKWEVEAINYTVLVGSSSRNQDLLQAAFRVREEPPDG